MPLGSFRLNSLAKSISQIIQELFNTFTWGGNASGQLGLGYTSGNNEIPFNISNLRNLDPQDISFSKVSAGSSHSLAITTSGELWAWGLNSSGQLGLGDVTARTSPTRVGTATNWAQASAGGAHSLAITTSGELWAWGNNSSGQLGRGDTTTPQTTPIQIGSATNWVQVIAGANHSLAITTSGELWAWGANASGQLGRGNTTSPQTSPIRIGTATNWASVNAGANHSLAITTSGELWAWGLNTNGQLGRGNTTSPQTSPIQVGTATNWAQATGGDAHTIAITTSGELWAWGSNVNGRLGVGDTTQRTSPTQVGTATNWAQASAGGAHSLAITTSGELYAWGSNLNGRLGVGDTTQRILPTQVGTATNWAQASAGTSHSLAITTSGELWAWGLNTNGRLGIDLDHPNPSGVELLSTIISAGISHSLAITTSGELYAWGDNVFGQLGRGDATTSPQTIPTQVGTATNWAKVSGGTHTVAITTSGELYAWGNNGGGQLGRGNTTTPQTTPIQIGSATNWAQVNCGNTYTMAITTTGELWAWGDNGSGQLGLGDITRRTSPTRVGSATNWAQVSCSQTNVSTTVHSLAVTTTGELWAWGNNGSGQLGFGDTTQRTSPTRVGTATNWASVKAASGYSLAVTTSGELWAWGNNATGQLGQDDITQRTSPTRVGSATNWAQVSGGGGHSLAITTSGELWAWGSNVNGRLGVGDTTQRTLPTQVGTATNWAQVSCGPVFTMAIKS
jgi:alpha-tubulin suppressor-like RCC1 family protein